MSYGNNIENTTKFYSGQGSLLVSLLDEFDQPVGGWMNVGDCESVAFDLAQEAESIFESQSGNRSAVRQLSTSKTASLAIDTRNFDPEILALTLFGETTVKSEVSVTGTDKAFKGRSIPVDGFIKEFTSLTNAAGDVTYDEGTDYVVNDGYIYITRNSSIADDSVVEYTYTKASVREIEGFIKNDVTVSLMFSGLNTVENNEPVKVVFYKVSLSPAQQRSLLTSTGVANQQIQGEVLSSNAVSGAGLSRMFKETHLA